MSASRYPYIIPPKRFYDRLRHTTPIHILIKFLPFSTHKPLRSLYYRLIQPGLSSLQQKLQEIITVHTGARGMLIFPPSLDWSAQMFQRPQQMASALAQEGVLIFYLQHRENWTEVPLTQIKSNLYVCNFPAEIFQFLEKTMIYIFTWNSRMRAAFNSPRILYDYVDDIHAFPGSYSRLQRDHQQLIQQAEYVFTTAKRLQDDVLSIRPDAVLCPNGVDYEHFVRARQAAKVPPPEDIQPLIKTANPIIGYAGALAGWFDYDLVAYSASVRPDFSFVLIGPDHDNSMPSSLLDRANIHWLGLKPYQELPDYLRHFDIAIIPFKLTDITHATSPIKLFEYFAAGKPTVITAMQESMQYPGVLVGENAEDFTSKLEMALQFRTDPDFLELIDQIAQQNTWDARARQMLEVIHP